jgi:HEAT repeat protein
LGNFEGEPAESALIASLEMDTATQVRVETARALGRMGGSNSVSALLLSVERDAEQDVKAQALRSLGALGDTRAVPILTNQLRKHPLLASAAAEGLGAIGGDRLETDLINALKGAPKMVVVSILKSLGETGGTNGLASVIHWARLVELDNICVSAASTMGRIGDARSLPALGILLTNKNDEVRSEASWALGHIGDTNAIPLLLGRAKSSRDEELFVVSFALAELGTTNAVGFLNSVLGRPRGYAKLAAACALAFLHQTNSIAQLGAALNSRESWQRFAAISALLFLNTAEALKCLKTCETDTNPALRALVKNTQDPAMAIAGLLTDKNPEMRQYAARVLLFFNNPSTLDALAAACKDRDPETRSAARLAYRRIRRLAAVDTVPFKANAAPIP